MKGCERNEAEKVTMVNLGTGMQIEHNDGEFFINVKSIGNKKGAETNMKATFIQNAKEIHNIGDIDTFIDTDGNTTINMNGDGMTGITINGGTVNIDGDGITIDGVPIEEYVKQQKERARGVAEQARKRAREAKEQARQAKEAARSAKEQIRQGLLDALRQLDESDD